MKDVLYDMPVMLLDCQATAAWSAGGRLLEMGWALFRACEYPDSIVTRHSLVSDEREPLPRRIKRLTGLDDEDFKETETPESIWEMLMRDAEAVREEYGFTRCPAVIHYAAFEKPFLKHLNKSYNSGEQLPLAIHCTHAMARRLYPELPRRSLRALAGYLGYGVPEERRCEHHILATARIWRHLVIELEQQYGIKSLSELNSWMKDTLSSHATAFVLPLDRDIRLSVPDTPGVYRMRRSNGDIIYVGKATSLRQRVNSYFYRGVRHPGHILEMLTQARDIDVTSTATPLEAALLESDEIKRLSPPYNVQLRTGDRTLVYLSRDFTDDAPVPDDNHTIGPLIKGSLTDRMKMCAMLLKEPAGDALLETVADILSWGGEGGDMPSHEIIAGGVDMFHDRYGDIGVQTDVYSRFMRIGKELHAEALDAGRADENGEADEADTDITEEDEWTPDRVVRRIEGIFRHGGYSVRRARWLLRLSESILTWNQPDDSMDSDMYAIVISGASVTWAGRFELRGEVPVKPDFSASSLQRQSGFGIAEYDRMRVLTTELRRLVKEKRAPRLKTVSSAGIPLEVLIRILQWV